MRRTRRDSSPSIRPYSARWLTIDLSRLRATLYNITHFCATCGNDCATTGQAPKRYAEESSTPTCSSRAARGHCGRRQKTGAATSRSVQYAIFAAAGGCSPRSSRWGPRRVASETTFGTLCAASSRRVRRHRQTTKVRRDNALDHRSAGTTSYSRHEPGTPFSSASPRSAKANPVPRSAAIARRVVVRPGASCYAD